MSNVTSASDDVKGFQCYHHNKGYCKFRDQCHFQHYKDICQNRVCKDLKCPFRHPKPCRNGENCKFLKLKKCAYKHDDHNVKISQETETSKEKVKHFEDQIKILKKEIADLKNGINNKTKELEKIVASKEEEKRSKELLKIKNLELSDMHKEFKLTFEAIKDENARLKDKIKQLKAAKVDLFQRIGIKDSLLKKVDSNFACDECEFKAVKLEELLLHVRSPHEAKSNVFFNCVECKITFKKEFDLRIHDSVKHVGKIERFKFS